MSRVPTTVKNFLIPKIRPELDFRSRYARIGKCLAFGCSPEQTATAAAIVRELSHHPHAVFIASRKFPLPPAAGLQGATVGSENGRDDAYGGSLSTSAQYTSLAELSCARLLRYTEDTAAEENKGEWRALRLGSPEQDLGVALRSSAVLVHNRTFARAEPSPVSVYTKYIPFRRKPPPHPESWPGNNFPRTGHNTIAFRTAIMMRSLPHIIADVVTELQIYKKSRPDVTLATLPSWFEVETKRILREAKEASQLQNRRYSQAEHLLRVLEQETWDRPDAVEDFGGAAPKAGTD